MTRAVCIRIAVFVISMLVAVPAMFLLAPEANDENQLFTALMFSGLMQSLAQLLLERRPRARPGINRAKAHVVVANSCMVFAVAWAVIVGAEYPAFIALLTAGVAILSRPRTGDPRSPRSRRP